LNIEYSLEPWSMQGYDLFMLVVLVAAIAWGAWKGLAWQIASIASLAVSYFVSLNFRGQLSQFITASPPWNVFLALLILFLGTSLVVWVGFNFVSELIEKVKLQSFDRQVGALFGFAKGVLLCVLITLFAVTLMSEPQRQSICNSRSGYYIAVLLDRSDSIMPREIHQVLDPYIRKFDEVVDQPQQYQAQQPVLPNLFGGDGNAPAVEAPRLRDLLPDWGASTQAQPGLQPHSFQPPAYQPSAPGNGRATIRAVPYDPNRRADRPTTQY
jgi:membrane protein required for colicin V production